MTPTTAEPHMCPKCSTETWTRNKYVVRCRICDHLWYLNEFYDTSENLHPYECPGPGKCRHCDRRVIYEPMPTTDRAGEWPYLHDPAYCTLCDPDYDGRPNAFAAGRKDRRR